MSSVAELKAKKRKYSLADDSVSEPSTKRPKTSKPKKDGKKKDKGKQKAQTALESQFIVVKATLALSIPPVFTMKPRAGAEEMLDSMVMRYIPALQGVMLAHDNLQFAASAANLKGECPFMNCEVSFDSTLWSPHVGMKLVGKVNLCSPDHVALLVHRTFNVSIPRHHIPTDNWEFEYGSLENDPEFGAGAVGGESSTSETVEGSGRWVHKVTGEKLGGEAGLLEFTVIGLTIANEMLSLVGSIQQDPFAPEHVPPQTIISTTTSPSKRKRVSPPASVIEDVEMLDEEEADDPYAIFTQLGRLNDAEEAARRAQKEAARRAQKEAAARDREEQEARRKKEEEKEARRKRKAEKAAANGGEQVEKKRKKKDRSA